MLAHLAVDAPGPKWAAMLWSGVTLPLRWAAARLGLCLAGIQDEELRRLRTRRMQWITFFAGAAALLGVLAGSIAQSLVLSGPRGSTVLAFWYLYLVAAPPLLVALAIWWYSAVVLRRALRDRTTYPVVRRGTVRRLLTAREGGWPLLLRDVDGRSMWLTGSREVLLPVRQRLARRRPGRPFQLTVTLAFHPRCRVVHEIRGMAVEDLDAAWEPTGAWAATRP